MATDFTDRMELQDIPMKKNTMARVIRTVAWMALLLPAFLFSGCNYAIMLGYLIGGPPSIEPDFDAMTGLSMSEKDVTVAVVCYAPDDVKWDLPDVDEQIARYVANRLNNEKIQVIRPALVEQWLDRNQDWDQPSEIGAALECTYVIYIDLESFGLYEPDSANLFRGRANGIVSVYEIDGTGGGDKIYSKELVSKYPLSVPRSTQETSQPVFQRQYLSRLSEEIGRLFYAYYNGDDIGDAA